MEIFGDGLMGNRLAGEDEVAAGVLDGGNDGLAGGPPPVADGSDAIIAL